METALTEGHNGARLASSLADELPGPLKVAIVGAGIGGLSAAIGLRRNGHQVNLYDQPRRVSEIGAAVHLAPNANGILRRWGIYAKSFGGVEMRRLINLNEAGKVLLDVDLTEDKRWQHPWELVHRGHLHDHLKRVALGEKGEGPPAKLYISSKVVEVNPQRGVIRLEDGTIATADVVIGADGIYSKSRTHIQNTKLFGSGKAAFRFLLPRKVPAADPLTAHLVEEDNALLMWFGSDRRVVMYPCNDNELLNFVCIHPESETHATRTDEWNKRGSVDQLLKVFKDFDPALRGLLSKVDPEALMAWRLMDMEKLPGWCSGRMALIGDAAHPFTPHLGQGAGQAMEDAATLSVVLPRGTAPEAVAERLQLYERIRYRRAHDIQDYSRQAGKDWIRGKPQIDMQVYAEHNFGHDELDNSTVEFNRYRQAKSPNFYQRMPVSFGPFPAPFPSSRIDSRGRSRLVDGRTPTFVTASIKFKTSRTFLETILPTTQFRFTKADTVCFASLSMTRFDKMDLLGGGGYSNLGLYVHGVEFVKKDGTTVAGTFVPVLFENLADAIFSWREELGMPKLFCDIDVARTAKKCRVTASWRGTTFAEVVLPGLRADDPATERGTIGGEADYGLLVYRYIPAVGRPGEADAEYACVAPHDMESRKVQAVKVAAVARSQNATVKMEAEDWYSLPTLHHVTSVLAQIPIYEVVSAKVVQGAGVPDMASCRRIE